MRLSFGDRLEKSGGFTAAGKSLCNFMQSQISSSNRNILAGSETVSMTERSSGGECDGSGSRR